MAAVTVTPLTSKEDDKSNHKTSATAAPVPSSATAASTASGSTAEGKHMIMDHITFTGADDKTPVASVIEFVTAQHNSQSGPRIEIGFLVARGEFGHPKYPTHNWIDALGVALNAACAKDASIRQRISVHVCNEWAAELAETGSTECFESVSVLKNATVTRVQLNFSRSVNAKKLDATKLLAALQKYPKLEFIFQLPRSVCCLPPPPPAHLFLSSVAACVLRVCRVRCCAQFRQL
jgi:hypothetical protein